MLEATDARDGVERAEAVAGDLPRVIQVDVETVPPTGSHLRRGQRDADSGATSVADEIQERPPPAARSSTRRPGPMPICSATYSCLRRWASSRLKEKSPSYLAPLKSASSPRLSRKMRSISE